MRKLHEHTVGALSPAWSNPYGLAPGANAQIRRATSSGRYPLARGTTLDEGGLSPSWRNPYAQPRSVRRVLRQVAPPPPRLPLGGLECLGDCGGCTKRGYCPQGCAGGCGKCSAQRVCAHSPLGDTVGARTAASGGAGITREQEEQRRADAGISMTSSEGVYHGPLRGGDKTKYENALGIAQKAKTPGARAPQGMTLPAPSIDVVKRIRRGQFPFYITHGRTKAGGTARLAKFYNESTQTLTVKLHPRRLGFWDSLEGRLEQVGDGLLDAGEWIAEKMGDVLGGLKDLACKALTAGNNSPQLKAFAEAGAASYGIPPGATDQALQLAGQLCGGTAPPPQTQDQQLDKAGSPLKTVAIVGGIGLAAYLLLA